MTPESPAQTKSISGPEKAARETKESKRRQEIRKAVGVEVVDVEGMLPRPIVNGSREFMLDSLLYERGKAIRTTPRGEKAVLQAEIKMPTILQMFSAPLGITLSEKDTPHIAEYLSTTIKYGRESIENAKNNFRRQRPYQYFGQPSGVPGKERPKDFTSYPSGHALRGWISAMALSAIAPEYADALFKAGYEYGQNRVIVGYHFQSDVDAGRMAAAISYSALSGDGKWLKLQKKARKELEKKLRKARIK